MLIDRYGRRVMAGDSCVFRMNGGLLETGKILGAVVETTGRVLVGVQPDDSLYHKIVIVPANEMEPLTPMPGRGLDR